MVIRPRLRSEDLNTMLWLDRAVPEMNLLIDFYIERLSLVTCGRQTSWVLSEGSHES